MNLRGKSVSSIIVSHKHNIPKYKFVKNGDQYDYLYNSSFATVWQLKASHTYKPKIAMAKVVANIATMFIY